MKNKSFHFYTLNLSVILYGLAGVIGKAVSLSPFQIVVSRTFIAALFLFIINLITRTDRIFDKKLLLKTFLPGCTLALHWYFFFLSVKISSVAIALITYSTFPVFVMLIKRVLYRTTYSKLAFLSILLVLTGIVILTSKAGIEKATLEGIAAGTFSGFLFAVLAVINEKLVRVYSSMPITFYENLQAFGLAFTLGLLSFHKSGSFSLSLFDILLVIFLGVFCTAVAHTLFVFSMKRVDSAIASVVACMEPVYGIGFSVALIGEMLTWNEITGGIITIAAVIMAVKSMGGIFT